MLGFTLLSSLLLDPCTLISLRLAMALTSASRSLPLVLMARATLCCATARRSLTMGLLLLGLRFWRFCLLPSRISSWERG